MTEEFCYGKNKNTIREKCLVAISKYFVESFYSIMHVSVRQWIINYLIYFDPKLYGTINFHFI